MKFTVPTDRAIDVSDGITPGVYDVQNTGAVDLYWGRTAETATQADGQNFAVGRGDEIYLDGKAGQGEPLFFRAVGTATQTGEVRLALKRPTGV